MGLPSERAYRIDADKMNALRQGKGLTIEDLAALAVVSERSIRRWLKGEPAFIGKIRKVAEKLGVSPCDLLRDDEELAPEDEMQSDKPST